MIVSRPNFCAGLELSFHDKDNNLIDHIQIAEWDDAWVIDPSDRMKDPDVFALKPNFKDLDEERFFLQVKDPNATTNTIIVNLESFDRGADPLTATRIDHQEGVVLTDIGNNTYRSGACLLVSDNDTVDDNFTGNISALDGTDDGGDLVFQLILLHRLGLLKQEDMLLANFM